MLTLRSDLDRKDFILVASPLPSEWLQNWCCEACLSMFLLAPTLWSNVIFLSLTSCAQTTLVSSAIRDVCSGILPKCGKCCLVLPNSLSSLRLMWMLTACILHSRTIIYWRSTDVMGASITAWMAFSSTTTKAKYNCQSEYRMMWYDWGGKGLLICFFYCCTSWNKSICKVENRAGQNKFCGLFSFCPTGKAGPSNSPIWKVFRYWKGGQ